MNISFYQVGRLFPENSTYLGELVELSKQEVNTNMANISRISLLLPNYYQNYNYVKVAKSVRTDYYYYFLDSWEYYNEENLKFYYKIDIVRTLKEHDLLNHDVNITQYSNVLEMNDKQKAYFWKNQQTQLSSSQISGYENSHIKYSDDPEAQKAWGDMKWLYVWLQPKQTASIDLGGVPYVYQYSFKKQIKESIINVLSTDIPLNKSWVDTTGHKPDVGWNAYPVGQVYHCTDTGTYYRFTEEQDYYNSIFKDTLFPRYRRYFKQIKDFDYKEYMYYFQDIPNVQMTNMPNSLYCMVLPLSEITVQRQWLLDDNRYYTAMDRSWNVENIIPYLFDVDGANNWNDWIVDIKLSLMPPFDINDTDYHCRAVNNLPQLVIPYDIPGRDLTPIKTLQYATVTSQAGNVIGDSIYFPFLRYKSLNIMEVESSFNFPNIDKELVFKKYYLSIVEERKELDIPRLKGDDALHLYYYEDLQPGRTNIVFGYAPQYENYKEIIYYLLHSPSTIFLDRDTSLPVFTTTYQNYLANNKNFVQQAQLQRKSELAQSLIGSGSSIVGASILQGTVTGYGGALTMSQAVGASANALINYDVQKKQFNWQVDNMKNAPGNYKAASATVSFMLSLNVYDLWIEVFTSNDFDIDLYNKLIDDIGFDYFNFSYNLEEIINNSYTGTSPKKYLKAWLTGITNGNTVNMPLINILHKQLKEGVSIFL